MFNNDFINVCNMAGVKPDAVSNLNYKLQEAENINDLTKEDHDLVKTCAGADLLTSSMSRTYCMLAAGVFSRCLSTEKKEDA
jgi:hypothetical protein